MVWQIAAHTVQVGGSSSTALSAARVMSESVEVEHAEGSGKLLRGANQEIQAPTRAAQIPDRKSTRLNSSHT